MNQRVLIDHVNFYVTHKDDEAAHRQFETLLRRFGHPIGVRNKAKAPTSPFLANPLSIGAGVHPWFDAAPRVADLR